jgi:hypothetical protein
MTTDDDGEISKKDPKIGNGLEPVVSQVAGAPSSSSFLSVRMRSENYTSDVLTISFKHRSHPSSKSIIEA